MRTDRIKSLFLCGFFLLAAAGVFAQSGSDEPEWLDDNELEQLEGDGGFQKAAVDKSLQANFVIVESSRVHELNPQTTTYASDAQLLSGLFEGLFSYNPVSLEPQYAIATSYRLSRDKKRWTFTLNPNAKFSNGERITARTVRESWLQLLSTPNAPYASLLDVVKGAEAYRTGRGSADAVGIYAVSDDTLSVHLVKPANYFPKILCHSAFSVVHRSPTVYSGAFYLYDFEDATYILKKNPYYWDALNTNLEQITIYQSDDADENAYCYNIGLADWVTADIDSEKLISKNSFQFSAEFATTYLFFKNSSAKPSGSQSGGRISVWDYQEFREALFEALPWDTLRQNYYVPCTTFVYPLSGYPVVEGYAYTDMIEAKSLMSEARKKYGIPEDDVLPLVLEISENSFTEDRLVALKEAWAQLGVDLQVRTLPVYYYLGNVRASEADLFCYTWIGDFADPLAFLELFRGDSTLNDSGWKNAEYDRLLESAALVSDEERNRLLGSAETLLLDSCMVIPVHHPVSFNVIDTDEVGGWASNAFDIHPLKYLYRKEAKSSPANVVLR